MKNYLTLQCEPRKDPDTLRCPKAAVPKLFGTTDRFRERQGSGGGSGGKTGRGAQLRSLTRGGWGGRREAQLLLALLAAGFLTGCGSEVGDPCPKEQKGKEVEINLAAFTSSSLVPYNPITRILCSMATVLSSRKGSILMFFHKLITFSLFKFHLIICPPHS